MNLLSYQQEIKKQLPLCPKLPEENWRKTDPNLFFLPPSEILNFQGHPVLESTTPFQPWKVSFGNEEELINKLLLLKSKFGPESENIFTAELKRIILVEIGHGVTHVFCNQKMHSTVEFSSSPMQTANSIIPNSQIGLALATRLKTSSPHQLNIKVNSKVESPLIIVTNHANTFFSQSYTSLSITVTEESNADLILTEEGAPFSFHRHSITLEKNSNLNQLWLNNSSLDNTKKNTLFERVVDLYENATFNDIQVMMPRIGNTKVTSNIRILGKKAQSISSVAVFASQGKFDYEPIQEHKAPQGKSSLNLKMILSGKSYSIFQGLVIVDKQAHQTSAIQTNKNLLLSKSARIDASPRLEILPNDVSCKHGSATSGELDPKQLYYLSSRGFSLTEAQNMIVKSFATEILSEFKSENSFFFLAQGALSCGLS